MAVYSKTVWDVVVIDRAYLSLIEYGRSPLGKLCAV